MLKSLIDLKDRAFTEFGGPALQADYAGTGGLLTQIGICESCVVRNLGHRAVRQLRAQQETA